MDAQNFRSLQEAYLEVVENQQLDEEKKPLPTARMANQRRGAWQKAEKATKTGNESERKKQIDRYNAMSFPETRRAHLRSKTQGESYDIYDIIFSHLLDEGYAETPEAAEAIMVNMSEDWRDDIIDEELTGERLSRAARKDGRDALAKKDRTILHRVMGHSNQDQTSFGKGNKATRRQGYTVPDTSNRPYQDEWRSSHNKNRGVKNKKSGNYN